MIQPSIAVQPAAAVGSRPATIPPVHINPIASISSTWPGCAIVLFGVLGLPLVYQQAMLWNSGSAASTVNASTIRMVCYGAIAIGILAGWSRERRKVSAIHTARASEISRIEREQEASRSKGDASERMVGQTLLTLAQTIDPMAWLGNGMVMAYPESRQGQMSRFEVDNLLITRFGVFLVEVKHWKNPVTISAAGWTRETATGVESVPSPIEQSAPKHRVLRQLVDQVCFGESGMPVESIVVLSHPHARFPMTAPEPVLGIADLRYYLRLAFLRAVESGMPTVHDVKRVKRAIDAIHDKDPMAKHHFLLELAAKKGYSQDYLELDDARLALTNLPPLQPRPFWKNWVTYVPMVLALSGLATYQTQWSHAQVGTENAPVAPPQTASLASAVTHHQKWH